MLIALRDKIASDIDKGVGARDLASLSLRLMDISEQIEELESKTGGVVADAAQTPDEVFDTSTI